MDKNEQLPVYLNFINTLKTGYHALDQSAQHQIADFVASRQHPEGGFVDRAGKPDLYYSLFGFWLSAALNLDTLLEKHKIFIGSVRNHPDKTIDLLAFTLIRTGMFRNDKAPSVWPIVKNFIRERNRIDLTYRFFLLLVVLDARGGTRKILTSLARFWFFFYRPADNIPCSISAALLFVRKRVGLNYRREQEKLLAFHVEGAGFKVFEHVHTCDLLSTAVALFALKESGYDLRLIAPDCLRFVEQNYLSGAFLSGDGDQTPDLEYTFYGLIALGSLIKKDEE